MKKDVIAIVVVLSMVLMFSITGQAQIFNTYSYSTSDTTIINKYLNEYNSLIKKFENTMELDDSYIHYQYHEAIQSCIYKLTNYFNTAMKNENFLKDKQYATIMLNKQMEWLTLEEKRTNKRRIYLEKKKKELKEIEKTLILE